MFESILSGNVNKFRLLIRTQNGPSISRQNDRYEYECNSSTSFKQGLRRVVNAALAITEVQLHAQQQLARELEVGSAVTEVQTAASTS